MGEMDEGFEDGPCKKPPVGWKCTSYDGHLGPCPTIAVSGYHVTDIKKGILGSLSKVQEELDELKDAEMQGVKLMELIEASDLIGALVRWLEANHPGTTLEDLIAMHKVTRRAFDSGRRTAK